MRFNGGVLFFHGVVLRDLAEFTEAIRWVYNVGAHRGHTLVAKNARARQGFLQNLFKFPDVGLCPTN